MPIHTPWTLPYAPLNFQLLLSVSLCLSALFLQLWKVTQLTCSWESGSAVELIPIFSLQYHHPVLSRVAILTSSSLTLVQDNSNVCVLDCFQEFHHGVKLHLTTVVLA